MKNGEIENDQIISNTDEGALHPRLDHVGGWSSTENDPWIMVRLAAVRNVSGIVTQGHSEHDTWVTTYTVEYSEYTYGIFGDWIYVKEDDQSEAKVSWRMQINLPNS